MSNGYQKFNGFEKTKEGWEFFKTFFYPNAQSKHVRPLAYNVKVLCVVGDFENGTFNLPQTLIRSINLNKPPQPLLHKARVIRWLRIINNKLKLK